MAEGKRPGGLTALAVFNFIFGALGALAVLALIAFFALMGASEAAAQNEEQRQAIEALKEHQGIFILSFVLTLASTVLLIASGVGYLKMKAFLGRTLGNTYAILAIAGAVVTGMMSPEELGGGFNLGTIIGLIYPVLTLALLNSSFKEDLVH